MKHSTCLILIATLILTVGLAHAQTLQNDATRIDFDLKTGTYSLSMPPASAPAIRNARATVETSVTAMLEGNDPIGKLVEPGETYLPEDSFYVDAATANPFEALEKYGRALREATGARPNVFDFPTVCAWYAGVWKTGGAQDHPDKSTDKTTPGPGFQQRSVNF